MARVTDPQCEIAIYTNKKAIGSRSKYQFDASVLRDPTGNKDLRRYKDGRAKEVQAWMKADPRVEIMIWTILGLAFSHLRSLKENFMSVGIEDHHGIWAAPALAELVADRLDEAGFKVSVTHRGLPS